MEIEQSSSNSSQNDCIKENSMQHKLMALFSTLVLVSLLLAPTGTAQAQVDVQSTQNEPLNCTFIIGPLTAGVSSTFFSNGDLFKNGA